MKRGDVILLILLGVFLLAGIAVFFLKPKALYCAVYEDGELLERYPMDRDITTAIQTDGGVNVLQIKDGKARITEADCANQICVHTAAASKAGDVIICLPHKLSVILERDR